MDDTQLDALLQHIKTERGFDFTGYKRASLERRIQRRMATVGMSDYDAYLDHLLVHPEEFNRLFDTILINVTSFFRDPDAWAYFRAHLLPPMLASREGLPIRVWSAGCASGEEAYTLAMILADELGVAAFRERVKIYATDVDEDALTQARQASYPAASLAAVPDELREKYFEQLGERFVFRKELRRSVIFGRNDLVQDAPISHVDVLTCRNTLMYFTAETQGQILNRLHFALRPEGVLFLGKAEMLLSHSAYFTPIELKRRFFAKVPDARDRRALGVRTVPSRAVEVGPDTRLQQAALMASASAQLVLDTERRLVATNHRAMNLFGLTARDVGRLVQDLEVSYRPLELRAHLEEATKQRRPVWVRDVALTRGAEDPLVLDVQVVPLTDEDGDDLGATVIFSDVTQFRTLQAELLYTTRQLETAYEELQSTNEELETTNEELQSTVEELETTNEELQSTNEELETMNEELQSTTDDQQLTNDALQDHQDTIVRLNRFLGSVLGAMSSAIVVVDTELRVLAWNSRATDLWGVRDDEALGADLMALDIGLPVEALRLPLLAQLDHDGAAPRDVELSAVNRRGRSVTVRVSVTRIGADGSVPPAAMLLMAVVEPTDASPPGAS